MSDKKVYNPRTGTYSSVAVKKEDKAVVSLVALPAVVSTTPIISSICT